MTNSHEKNASFTDTEKSSSDGWTRVIGVSEEKPAKQVRHIEEYPDTEVKKPGDLFRTEAEILKNRSN